MPLLVHSALAVPLVYDSMKHLARARARVVEKVAQLRTHVDAGGLMLKDGELNSFSMPGTFAIAYQVRAACQYSPFHPVVTTHLHALCDTRPGFQRCTPDG